MVYHIIWPSRIVNRQGKWDTIVQNTGLKPIRLHDLRHTYATLQRKAGQPIEVISRVLGHASEMVTLTVYNHWEGDLRAPADTMDLMLEKASQKQDEKALVRHSLEELEGIESRPCMSIGRTKTFSKTFSLVY